MMKHKRKHEEEAEKKIVIFVSSVLGTKCAGVFEFNIQLDNNNNSNNNNDEEVNSDDLEKGYPLEPIGMFFDQRDIKTTNHMFHISSVGSYVLGSKLYMFPDDTGTEPISRYEYYREGGRLNIYKTHTRKPLIFDLITHEEQHLPALPQVRKIGPIVTIALNQLFVLSAYKRVWIPHPCFESLKLDLNNNNNNNNNAWIELPCPPFHQSDVFSLYLSVTGYALLEDDSILLVTLSDLALVEVFYFTYNFRSKLWKTTNRPPTPCFSSDTYTPRSLYKKALVVGHYIYTFHPSTLQLLVFSYDNNTNSSSTSDSDIELVELSIVRGFLDGIEFELPSANCFLRSAAIAKVVEEEDGGWLFCLLHTIYHSHFQWEDRVRQDVHVSFVRIVAPKLCKLIKSFTCTLFLGTELWACRLESCHVLPLDDAEDKENQHRVKRAANDGDAEAATSKMEMDCDGTRDGRVAARVEAAM